MKIRVLLFAAIVLLLLSGCAIQTFETVEDPDYVEAMVKPGKLLMDLPEDTVLPAMQSASGMLYFCEDYEISVETVPSGNLSRTMQTLTGFDKAALQPIRTEKDGVDCYECVWTFAGEGGDHVGRLVILDDGSYHYCVSVTSLATYAGTHAQAWNELFQSVTLAKN